MENKEPGRLFSQHRPAKLSPPSEGYSGVPGIPPSQANVYGLFEILEAPQGCHLGRLEKWVLANVYRGWDAGTVGVFWVVSPPRRLTAAQTWINTDAQGPESKVGKEGQKNTKLSPPAGDRYFAVPPSQA